MRLERVTTLGLVGGGEPLRLDLGPGCNVILGGNESGKTACVWALRQAFLGADPDHYYVNGGEAWVEVLMSVGQDRDRIHRDLRSGHLIWSIQDAQGAESVLYEGSGGDEEFHAVTDERIGRELLDSWIQELESGPDGRIHSFTGGDAALAVDDHVLDRMRLALAAVDGTDTAEPGELQIIEDEIRRQHEMFDAWRERMLQSTEDDARREELEQKLEEAESAAEARDEVLATLTRFQSLGEERVVLARRVTELEVKRDQVKKHVEAVEKADAELEANFGDFLNVGPELEDALQTWTEATTRLHDLQRRLHLTRQAQAVAPKVNTKKNGSMVAGGLGALSFLACMGAGAMAAGFLVGPLMAGLGYGAIWAKDRSADTLRAARRQEMEFLDEEIVEVERDVETAKGEMGTLGHLGHPMAIRKAVIQYWRAREGVERLRRERDSHATLAEVVEELHKAIERSRAVETDMRNLTAGAQYLVGLDEHAETLAGEVSMASAQSDASHSRADRLAQELKAMTGEFPGEGQRLTVLGRAEREYRELVRRRDELRLEAAALRAATEIFGETLQDHRLSHTSRIAQRAGTLVSEFSQHRWTAVRFTGGAETEIADAQGNWTSRDRLSGGARGQLDLAVRLAVAEEAGRAADPPLVLDEPFAQWDRLRLEAAQLAIRAHAQRGGQVVILSHDERFGSWADVAIQLPSPGDELSAA